MAYLQNALVPASALFFSGVTQPSDLPVDPTPDLVAKDLTELVKQYLGR